METYGGCLAHRLRVASEGDNKFDGDELNMLLILDHYTHDRLSRLAPHLSVLDLERPRSVSRNIKMPSPVLVTIGNWLTNGA